MKRSSKFQQADRRPVVLVIFAVLILAPGWRTAKPAAQPSSYFFANGALLRTSGSGARPGIPLTGGLSCADTPPAVARFFALPLPVNRADQHALTALPGIGPRLAESILKHRAEQGRMAGPDDLRRIKGIGPKRLARLTPLLCFDHAQ